LNRVPVSQDASASAYQIMSYLLLNVELGILTNLLPSKNGEIQDLYSSLMDELREFLSERLNKDIFIIINKYLNRKLCKALFMPLIYGKTVSAMSNDIVIASNNYLKPKQGYMIAKLCYEFWKMKYPDIINLMMLINQIGWFCSALDKPVCYSTSYFTTVQDYMRSKKAQILVYDKVSLKRHRVTLRVPTGERDTRKTSRATCVNFIHQKDAFIAMKVVDKFKKNTDAKAPVYTVHDNFITTSFYAEELPKIYTTVFMEIGNPLFIINDFIRNNLIQLSNKKLPSGQFTSEDLKEV
jgi:DNA-directed RNA polymerase